MRNSAFVFGGGGGGISLDAYIVMEKLYVKQSIA